MNFYITLHYVTLHPCFLLGIEVFRYGAGVGLVGRQVFKCVNELITPLICTGTSVMIFSVNFTSCNSPRKLAQLFGSHIFLVNLPGLPGEKSPSHTLSHSCKIKMWYLDKPRFCSKLFVLDVKRQCCVITCNLITLSLVLIAGLDISVR